MLESEFKDMNRGDLMRIGHTKTQPAYNQSKIETITPVVWYSIRSGSHLLSVLLMFLFYAERIFEAILDEGYGSKIG